jgi:hypothetical protein
MGNELEGETGQEEEDEGKGKERKRGGTKTTIGYSDLLGKIPFTNVKLDFSEIYRRRSGGRKPKARKEWKEVTRNERRRKERQGKKGKPMEREEERMG